MYSLESPHQINSNEYTQHTIIVQKVERISLNCHLLPDLVPWLTLNCLNYPYLEHTSMVPKMFQPLKFDCINWLLASLYNARFYQKYYFYYFFIKICGLLWKGTSNEYPQFEALLRNPRNIFSKTNKKSIFIWIPLLSGAMCLTGLSYMICSTRKGPLCNLRTTQALISLPISAGWSVPSLSAYRIDGYCRICRQTKNVEVRLHRSHLDLLCSHVV